MDFSKFQDYIYENTLVFIARILPQRELEGMRARFIGCSVLG
jgi:hypothetical protein